jgi:hypothetical protein
MNEAEKRKEIMLRWNKASTLVIDIAGLHEVNESLDDIPLLLNELDAAEREVERLTERKNELRESRRFWRREHNTLLLENQRLRKAWEEIANCEDIDSLDDAIDVARQALAGDLQMPTGTKRISDEVAQNYIDELKESE